MRGDVWPLEKVKKRDLPDWQEKKPKGRTHDNQKQERLKKILENLSKMPKLIEDQKKAIRLEKRKAVKPLQFLLPQPHRKKWVDPKSKVQQPSKKRTHERK